MINKKNTALIAAAALSACFGIFVFETNQEKTHLASHDESGSSIDLSSGNEVVDQDVEIRVKSLAEDVIQAENTGTVESSNGHSLAQSIETDVSAPEELSDIKEQIYSCFDFDLLSFHRTPICNENLAKVYEVAATTTNFEEMRFAIATLYTETDPDTLRRLIEEYSSGTTVSEYDTFDLFLVAYGSGDTTRGTEILYDNFRNLSDKNKALLIPTLVDTTINIIRYSPSGHSAQEPAQRILDDAPTALSTLSRVRLEAATEGNLEETEYAVGKILSWPPIEAAKLVLELYSECDYLIDLCTKVLEENGPVKQYFLLASQDYKYSEADRQLFADLATLQIT